MADARSGRNAESTRRACIYFQDRHDRLDRGYRGFGEWHRVLADTSHDPPLRDEHQVKSQICVLHPKCDGARRGIEKQHAFVFAKRAAKHEPLRAFPLVIDNLHFKSVCIAGDFYQQALKSSTIASIGDEAVCRGKDGQ